MAVIYTTRTGAQRVWFTGTEEVVRNINRSIAKMKNGSVAGMRLAVQLVKERTLPITPVKTGNLRGGMFAEVRRSGTRVEGVDGFTASYAPFVHEVQATHDSPTQWKFLEEGLRRSAPDIPRVMALKVKP
jgi:hypothetical protein